MRPARVVGGDFYDYFRIDDDRVAMIIADVSDKGVPASLFMVISKTVIKMCIMENPDDLRAAVEKANRLLCEANKEMMFVTAYIGIYSVSEGLLTYVNAGHERPVFYSGGTYSIIDMNHDLFLAAYEDETFEVRTLHLESGDRLLLYTDGVTEAMDTSDNQLGEDGLLRALESQTDINGNEIINLVWDTVSSFQKGKEQSDDVTILLFEV
jgi:sigma-B regulation protein RsbU (phosphoserine phosphatase)